MYTNKVLCSHHMLKTALSVHMHANGHRSVVKENGTRGLDSISYYIQVNPISVSLVQLKNVRCGCDSSCTYSNATESQTNEQVTFPYFLRKANLISEEVLDYSSRLYALTATSKKAVYTLYCSASCF